MGLEQREAGRYITILEGKFCIRVPQGTEGSTARVNKLGNTVHEKYYDSFTGKLVGIKTQDSSYGKNWMFEFQDGGEVYNLQLSYSNSFAKNILKILPNVDLNKEMKVQPAQKVEDGKKKSSLFISQDGVTLKHAYTRENPNGLPPMTQVTVKGVQQWDDTDQVDWLKAMVDQHIVPKLPEKQPVVQTPATGLAVEENPLDSDDDSTDEDDY